jgi:NADPH-dependent 7-cyano-7-deazaguanine reductase QueF
MLHALIEVDNPHTFSRVYAARQDLHRGWAVCLLTGAPQWLQRSRPGVFMVVP